MKVRRLFFAFLLFVPFFVAAQESLPKPASARLLIALSFTDIPEEKKTDYLSSVVTALARLETLGGVRLYPDAFSYGLPESERLAQDYAVRSGCRLVLSIGCTQKGKSLLLRWKVRDIVLKTVNPEKFQESAIPDAGALAEYFWLDVAGSVEKTAVLELPQEFMTIEGPPGASVSGLGKENLVIPEEGSMQAPVNIPQSAVLRITNKGFMPQERKILIDRPGMTEIFDLKPFPAWVLEANLYNLQFPGFRLQWRPTRGFWFVQAGIDQYLVGITLMEQRYDFGEENPKIIGGTPLFHLFAGAGMDISPVEKPFGFYADADIFLRMFLPSWRSMSVDPVAPMGIRPAIGAEYRPTQDFTVFAEYGVMLYFFADSQLLDSIQNLQKPRFGIALNPKLFFEWMSVKAGVRWRLP